MIFAGIKTALVMCAALFLICSGLILATATALSTATSPSSVGSPLPGIIPETAAEENKLPDELTNTDNMYRRGIAIPHNKEGHEGYAARIKFPAWSFKLEKDVYHPGEMIYGRLTIKNEDPKYRFMFIPPYHGALVDNVEVWFQKTDEKKLTRAWPYLKNLIYSWDNSIRCGVPVVLEPGETYEALISVNSYWVDDMAEHRQEFYGASVVNQPGEYRFYLRYLNLYPHRQIPSDAIHKPKADRIYEWPTWRDRKALEAKKGEILKMSDHPVIELADKPIILGPFTVKIEPWPTEAENKAAEKLVKIWDHIAEEPSDCIAIRPRMEKEFVDELLGVLRSSNDEPCSIHAMLQMQLWIESHPDFCRVPWPEKTEEPVSGDNPREPAPADAPVPPAQEPEKELTGADLVSHMADLLKDLGTMKAHEKPGVLRDLMCYWEVRALIDLGLRAEALKAARENPTPDIMMLIGVRIGLKFNDKWREDGAPYAIPADNYTAPEPPPAAEENATPQHGIE